MGEDMKAKVLATSLMGSELVKESLQQTAPVNVGSQTQI